MGISSKKPRKTSRRFQFKIVEENGAIGNTNNTLYLSGVTRDNETGICEIKFFSIQ